MEKKPGRIWLELAYVGMLALLLRTSKMTLGKFSSCHSFLIYVVRGSHEVPKTHVRMHVVGHILPRPQPRLNESE